jgi:hypothetical protein
VKFNSNRESIMQPQLFPLEQEKIDQIRRQVELIRENENILNKNIWILGEYLREVQQMVEGRRGGFGFWIEQHQENLGISKSTAYKYMNFRETVTEEQLPKFVGTAARALAGRPNATAAALRMAERGEEITSKVARRLAKRHKEEPVRKGKVTILGEQDIKLQLGAYLQEKIGPRDDQTSNLWRIELMKMTAPDGGFGAIEKFQKSLPAYRVESGDIHKAAKGLLSTLVTPEEELRDRINRASKNQPALKTPLETRVFSPDYSVLNDDTAVADMYKMLDELPETAIFRFELIWWIPRGAGKD